MNIDITKYLDEDEIREIVEDEVRRYVRGCIGEISFTNSDKSRVLISKLAKNLAKEGVQELIPNFKELINEHIKSEVSTIKLSDFFMSTMGWRTEGNKILNAVLNDNKSLIDAKVKEIFKPYDK